MNDRSSIISIGNKEYELILTTYATKEIAKRYGGIANLGDKLLQNENFELALDEIIWLITLLANQSIMLYNLDNSNKKELLTTDYVALKTLPYELASFKEAIMDAMYKGTKRDVESEVNENTKN